MLQILTLITPTTLAVGTGVPTRLQLIAARQSYPLFVTIPYVYNST